MKFNVPFSNFLMGEWSPKMKSRVDLPTYPQACEELTNMVPTLPGGAYFRGGSKRQPLVDDATILLNTGFGVRQNMFHYTPSDATKAAYLVMAEGAVQARVLNGNSFTLVGTTYYMATANQPFPAEVQAVQLQDFLVTVDASGARPPLLFYYDRVSASYQQRMMEMYWIGTGVAAPDSWRGRPWGQVNALSRNVTMSFSATTGVGVTCTASAAYFYSPLGTGAEWIGTHIRLCKGSAKHGIAQITGWTSTTVVTCEIISALSDSAYAYGSSANPTSFWQIGAWNQYFGWPRSVTTYQGRLIFGGTAAQPDTLWGSRIGSPFDFEEIPSPDTTGFYGFANDAYTTDNTRPFTLTPSSTSGNIIRSLSAGKTLVINTDKGEIIGYGTDGAMGPVNATFESSTAVGSSSCQPIRVGNSFIFGGSTGYDLRDLFFNFQEDQYKVGQVSLMAEHFFDDVTQSTGRARILNLEKLEGFGQTILFMHTAANKVFGCVLDKDSNTIAWFRVAVGGTNLAGSITSSAAVHTMTVNATTNELVLLVRRGDNFHVETISFPAYSFPNGFISSPTMHTLVKPVFLDGSQAATATASLPSNAWKTIVSGDANSWYKNLTVSIVADGAYLGEVLIDNNSDGTFVLPDGKTASHVLVGYKYKGVLKTMPVEVGGQYGAPVGRQKRINELAVRLFRSLGVKVGKDEASLEQLPLRLPSQPMSEPTEYFTGTVPVTFPAGYDRDLQVLVQQDEPYPLHVVGVAAQGVAYD